MTVGSLNFVISADASEARRELATLQQESQFVANAVRTIFSQETIRGAGIQVLSASAISLTENLARANGELRTAELLTRALKDGFLSLLALPFPDLQEQALAALGFGQATEIVQILSLGAAAFKAFTFPVNLASQATLALSESFERLSAKLQGFADLLGDIAASLRQAGSVFEPVARLFETSSRSVEGFAKSAAAGRDGLNSLALAIGRLDSQLQDYLETSEAFRDSLSDLGDAAALFNAFNAVNSVTDPFLGSLEETFNSALAAETFTNQLTLASSAANGARDDLEFLQDLTKDLGLNFSAAADGFVSFSVAANLAGISSEQTRVVFEGISQAASAMGLSAAETQGVFLALQQSLSSGNIQLEELNQLAERIPGTFQAAAKALGVTTQELKGLISSGNVQSSTFIPAFAEQLKLFTDPAVVDGLNSGQAAINRFNNSLGAFRVAAGQTWLEVGVPALNAFAAALEFAAKNEELFSSAIDALVVASVPLFLSGIGKATVALIKFFAANETARLTILGQQFSITAAQLSKLAASAAVAYAALIVLYRTLDRVRDSGEQTRAAIASLDRSLAQLKDNQPELERLLPEDPPPLDWLDVPIVKLKEIGESGNFVQRTLGNAFGNIATLGLLNINKLVNYWKTGSFEIVTAGEKALNDQLIAISDFSVKAQEILGRSLEFRSQNRSGNSLAELKQIEAALKRIEAARLAANPKDSETLSKLAAEETALLKRRGAAQQEILDLQSALNNALSQAKQELQNLDPSKLGTRGYEQAREQLQAQINLLEREQAQFNELTKTAEFSAESIAAAFERASGKLDLAYSNIQAQIEESLASGAATQEQAQQRRLEAERQFLDERLKLNRETEAKLRTELERNAKLRAIDPSKATLDAKQEEEYKKQLEKIEIDIAKTRIDLAQSTLAQKKALSQQELDEIRTQQEQAAAILQRTENNRTAAIKQRQLLGALSEEEANRQIEQAQQNSINRQIEQEQQKLERIKSLRLTGVLGVQEAAQQEQEILAKLSDLNLQRIQRELEARQEANRKALAEFEAGIRQADAAIAQSQAARRQALAQSQLAGLSDQAAARETVELERQSIAETLALRERELQQIASLRQRGVLNAEEAARRELEVVKQLSDLKLQQIEAEISAQQQLLSALAQASSDSGGAVEQRQAEQIAAIREAQAEGVKSEEEANRAIAEINRQGALETLRIRQDELAELNRLRRSGVLSIEAAADRERELIGEIANARQAAAQAELTLREQIRSAIEADAQRRLETEQRTADWVAGFNEQQIQALANQNNLLSAQSALLDAQSSLRQQRLEAEIQEAEESGRASLAERLRKQLLDEQVKTQERQAAIAREQLRLKQQQNALELENQRIQAETAVLEAQINLEKAKVLNASLQEIANLERVLGLRNHQLRAISSQVSAQQQINSLEEQALRLQQQKTQEALKQRRVSASVNPGLARDSGLGRAPTGSVGASLTESAGVITQITDQLSNLSRKGSLADAFNIANLKLNLKTGFVSPDQLAAKLGANSPGEILGKLDQLIAATRDLAGRPNLSISNVNDLGLAGRIYSDISRSGLRGAGL